MGIGFMIMIRAGLGRAEAARPVLAMQRLQAFVAHRQELQRSRPQSEFTRIRLEFPVMPRSHVIRPSDFVMGDLSSHDHHVVDAHAQPQPRNAPGLLPRTWWKTVMSKPGILLAAAALGVATLSAKRIRNDGIHLAIGPRCGTAGGPAMDVNEGLLALTTYTTIVSFGVS